MPRDDATFLDIDRAARLAIEFLGDLGKEAFSSDSKTTAAVLHELLVLGEAVKRLSEAAQACAPDVPWKQIAGMRDVLIHHYDSVDHDEVWRVVNTDLPALLAKIEPLVPKRPS